MRPSPLDYTDYRTFLGEYYAQRKREGKAWSLRVWARQLGVRSPSTLTMILRGQRAPSLELAERLGKKLKFTAREQEYFTNLIRLGKFKDDPQVTTLLIEQLAASRTDQTFWTLDHETFRSIANWYFYAIRQLTKLPDFVEDPDWIASRLRYKVSPKKIREALAIMLDHGLLERDARGTLRVGPAQLNTPHDRASEALKLYHAETLDNAKQALQTVDPAQREISGGCFPIRASSLPEAKRLIRNFQRDLCRHLSDDAGEDVYQIEVAFFPLTQERKSPHV